MNEHPRDPRLEKFLDGLLSPEEMAATRRAIESDPELKREAELQNWIDAELDEMFAYDTSRAPVLPAVPEDAEAPEPIRIETRRPRMRMWAIAAAVLLVGVVVRISISVFGPSTTKVQYASADAVYNKLVARGFTPDIVCTTEDQFKDFTQKRLGQPLLLAAAPNVQALGWAYSVPVAGKIVGDRSVLLYMKVDSREVLVLMDSTDRPKDHPITVAPPLHVFREQVGPITTYEITPLDSARVVKNLREVK